MYECPVCGITFHHDDNPQVKCGPNNAVVCCSECAAEIEELTKDLPKDFNAILAQNNLAYFLAQIVGVDLSNSEEYILRKFTMKQIVNWIIRINGGDRMRYKIEVYDAYCALSKFVINEVEANEDDFVDKYDHSPGDAEEYGCGDMRADIKPVTQEILNKYKITVDEYNTIAEDVSEKLSFGRCGWCV